jgi:hypothetical protein
MYSVDVLILINNYVLNLATDWALSFSENYIFVSNVKVMIFFFSFFVVVERGNLIYLIWQKEVNLCDLTFSWIEKK